MADELGLQEDDLLETRLEDGKIVLIPTVAIPNDQAWYWSEEWQAKEREVDEQMARGEITEPMRADEALSVLNRLMTHGHAYCDKDADRLASQPSGAAN